MATNIASILNNREIAVILWGLLFFLWALKADGMRTSLLNLARVTFRRQLLVIFAGALGYLAMVCLPIVRFGYLDAVAQKQFIAWSLTVGAALLLNTPFTGNPIRFFRTAALHGLTLTALLEFVMNLHSFSLIAELILVPVLTVLVGVRTLATSKEEHSEVLRLTEWMLAIVGLWLISATALGIASNEGVTVPQVLREWLLPLYLTISFLPFIYVLALYGAYETVFKRLRFANRNDVLARRLMGVVIRNFHFRLVALQDWSGRAGWLKFRDVEEIRLSISSNSARGDNTPSL